LRDHSQKFTQNYSKGNFPHLKARKTNATHATVRGKLFVNGKVLLLKFVIVKRVQYGVVCVRLAFVLKMFETCAG
jgi:hypothetical protein